MGNAGLVSLGVVSDLMNQAVFVFLSLTLCVLLNHVHRGAARAMVVLVTVAAGIAALNVVFEFAGLQVAPGAVDVLTAFLFPAFNQLIHAFVILPVVAIAEIWMAGYLLTIGVNTKKFVKPAEPVLSVA